MVDKTNVKTDHMQSDGIFTPVAYKKSDLSADELKAFAKQPDRYGFADDGTLLFKDDNGDTQVVPKSISDSKVDLSKVDQAAVKRLADLTYLAQNTGVSSAELNKAYEAVGIDPNDTFGSMNKKQALLKAAGYTPGSNRTFYGNNQAQDVGAQILYDRWSQAPSAEELEAAGIDPSTVSVINSGAANAAYLAEEMARRNISSDQTKARVSGANRLKVKEADRITDKVLAERPNSYWTDRIKKAGSYGEATLDMLEWDLLKKQKEEGGTTGYTVDQPSASVTGTNSTTPGQGQITGGAVGTTTPSLSSTPNLGFVTPVYAAGQTGTSETPIPTYEEGLKKQATQFADRATCQATFYQPQTQQEKEAAGTAPAFENVMYRNRFGMSMYIQHINGVPSQPIPPGYSRVQDVTAQTNGAVAQGQNSGGVVRGLAPGGMIPTDLRKDAATGAILTGSGANTAVYNAPENFNYDTYSQNPELYSQFFDYTGGAETTVNPALNYKPGGTFASTDDGKFVIKYPDGTTSQAYTSISEAQAADTLGRSKLNLPSYQDYLSQQGFDPNAAGYDYSAIASQYQSYLADPSSIQNAQEQKAADEASAAPTPTGVINQDFVSGQQDVTPEGLAQYQRNLEAQAYAAPGGAIAASPVSYLDPNAYGSVLESTAGQAQATAPMVQSDQVAQISAATTADTPQKIGAAQMAPNYSFSDVQNVTAGMTAAQSTGPTQTIEAAQQTGTSLSGLTSATADSIDVSGAPTRTQQTGEMIQGTGVDQAQVGQAFGTGEVQAASIQGELTNLMQQFEGGETPAWAAGSMRAATQMLAARGLGASSMAGQAVIQAAMEAALPIAQIDTANKQQVALFKAEQRAKFLQMDFDQSFQAKVMNAAKVSEIANMNFTADQQIALENSKAANTMQMQNLSNSQALVMAEAAALAQMDTQNLNNRQQAQVQNAQNFLQVDMANLNNEQQTALFKQQSLVNSLLTDQAAANAALQFNATSENQTNQFFANLSSAIGQFNAAQMNAMKQFNAGEVNSLLEFNASIQNQREMFNAQNYLVVAQANAQWRQNLTTINTATANESNMDYAKTVNALTMSALDQIWQKERDLMDYSFTGKENAADRALSILLGDKQLEAIQAQLDAEEDAALGSLLTKIFF